MPDDQHSSQTFHSRPLPTNDSLDDEKTLGRFGYAQELRRRLGAFSNFAISLSIICILVGGITSFHLGYCAVGGAAIGLGWPLVTLFSLAVAATMGQVASAFPTAGGLYHWASILGGRGWGWGTAWFNLAGLVTILAGINVGTYLFALGTVGPRLGIEVSGAGLGIQLLGVALITLSQAAINHLGLKVTTVLIDISGYLILIVATALTIALLWHSPSHDLTRLVDFTNFSGLPPNRPVWPRAEGLPWLFALGFLLPAFTLTGFDASAHASEETIGAARVVPRGIIQSVLVSGVFGWLMLSAIVLAIPHMEQAAHQGESIVPWVLDSVLPRQWSLLLCVGIAAAQYLCGLATVTSASRMAYAFARDGGLPFSGVLRRVSPRLGSPGAAIWSVALGAIAFTGLLSAVSTSAYSAITTACTLFLYVSYVVPTGLGFLAYGKTWTAMGPWNLGPLYKPLAAVCVVGCAFLMAIGSAPPNQWAFGIVVGSAVVLTVVWLAVERRRFPGPPTTGGLQ
jgi:amino acid transporter